MAVTATHTPALAAQARELAAAAGPVADSPLCVPLCRRACQHARRLAQLSQGACPAPVHGHGRTVRPSGSRPLLSVTASQDVSVPVAPQRLSGRRGQVLAPIPEVGTCAGT